MFSQTTAWWHEDLVLSFYICGSNKKHQSFTNIEEKYTSEMFTGESSQKPSATATTLKVTVTFHKFFEMQWLHADGSYAQRHGNLIRSFLTIPD